MKAEDFLAFLALMKWSDAEAMRQLGIGSHNTLASYKQNGGPLWLGLACAAAAKDLPPWKATANLVTVYGMTVWDGLLDETIVAPSKRTHEAIMAIRNAAPIPGSAEQVDPALLDAQGRYYPPRKVK